MRKGQIGCVQVGKENFWSLPYADNLIPLAKSEEEMEEMIEIEQILYLKKKRLQLSTENNVL